MTEHAAADLHLAVRPMHSSACWQHEGSKEHFEAVSRPVVYFCFLVSMWGIVGASCKPSSHCNQHAVCVEPLTLHLNMPPNISEVWLRPTASFSPKLLNLYWFYHTPPKTWLQWLGGGLVHSALCWSETDHTLYT